jgi:hypothetical protein
MNIEQMREEYEAWAIKSGLSTVRTPQALMFANGQRRAAGDYIMIESICAWEAWQQSRASLVIELPQRLSFEMQGITIDPKGDLIEYCDTVAAIQSTGVKVK